MKWKYIIFNKSWGFNYFTSEPNQKNTLLETTDIKKIKKELNGYKKLQDYCGYSVFREQYTDQEKLNIARNFNEKERDQLLFNMCLQSDECLEMQHAQPNKKEPYDIPTSMGWFISQSNKEELILGSIDKVLNIKHKMLITQPIISKTLSSLSINELINFVKDQDPECIMDMMYDQGGGLLEESDKICNTRHMENVWDELAESGHHHEEWPDLQDDFIHHYLETLLMDFGGVRWNAKPKSVVVEEVDELAKCSPSFNNMMTHLYNKWKYDRGGGHV